MLLSINYFELLKIACWCKSIPAIAGTVFDKIYTQEDISALNYFGFVSLSRDGRNIRPRPEAYRLLNDAGISFKPDSSRQTNSRILERRNITSQLLFTFLTAGISVFNDELPRYVEEPLFVSSFAAKQKDNGNPLGNARFYGVFCTPQKAFLVYFAENTELFLQNELVFFNNFVEITGIEKRSIIMMGGSTSEIGSKVLTSEKGKRKNPFNNNTFSEIFETTPIPVHFIPLGDTGAQILKFMLIPNYRETIAKAVLKDGYRQPYEGFADTDAIHHKEPFYPAVVAVDMDVNRIDRAVKKAQGNGFDKIVIYALSEQMELLKSRYGNNGKADVIQINIINSKKGSNYDVDLYLPPSTPYFTKEGRCFSVSDFAAYRKAGKQTGQEDRTVSEP